VCTNEFLDRKDMYERKIKQQGINKKFNRK